MYPAAACLHRLIEWVLTSSQGDIAFPIGTALEIEDFQKLMPAAPRSLATRVMQNDGVGVRHAWDEFYDPGTA
ncbi:MAG: hypothetical protein ACLPXB_16120 [Thiobacillaceae bacterium]